jgi:hypothetical protein
MPAPDGYLIDVSGPWPFHKSGPHVTERAREALIAEGWLPPQSVDVYGARASVADEALYYAAAPIDPLRRAAEQVIEQVRRAIPVVMAATYDPLRNLYNIEGRARVIRDPAARTYPVLPALPPSLEAPSVSR